MTLFSKKNAIIIFLSITCALHALGKPPEITPSEAKTKIHEIFQAHYKFKHVTPMLVRRAFSNYINDLDPLKLYFIQSEVDEWLTPLDTLVDNTIISFHKAEYPGFEKMYSTMLSAIDRRTKIDSSIDPQTLSTEQPNPSLEWTTWAKDHEELKKRLMTIQVMHRQMMDKLPTQEQRDLYIQRLTTRRQLRENSLLLAEAPGSRQRQMLSYMIKAFAQALDTHTMYFTPEESQQFIVDVQQKLSGIGAMLKDDLKGLCIVSIVEGGPASLQKELRIGDRIIAVNHEPIVGLDILQSVEMIRGKAGTPVILTIVRESGTSENIERFDVEIVRDDVIMKDSRYSCHTHPYGQGVIVHLRLHAFYQDMTSSCADDLKKALSQVKKDHEIEGVILDLRGNMGGLLSQAVLVSGMFIGKGIVVSVKDHAENIQHLRNFNEVCDWDGPLVIMTDRLSASAAEIVAQTLQDYGRAILVGDECTCGKGSYQTMTMEFEPHATINAQGEYKVTRGMYYTVSGKSPQLVGVKTDIHVPGFYTFMNFGENQSKFPLENDSISPNFKDSFEDIHPLYRRKLRKLFTRNVQNKLKCWEIHIPELRKNSAARIAVNEEYQSFLREVEKKEFDEERLQYLERVDFQWEETLNITKDLIHCQKK